LDRRAAAGEQDDQGQKNLKIGDSFHCAPPWKDGNAMIVTFTIIAAI
jgi:hypothetical protein